MDFESIIEAKQRMLGAEAEAKIKVMFEAIEKKLFLGLDSKADVSDIS